MIITLRQLLDYITCPMLYKYRYVDNIELYTEEELFNTAVTAAIDQMYFSLLHGQLMSKADLKYAWGDIWKLNLTPKQIMWSNSSKRKMQIKGLRILLNIHSLLYENPVQPVIINDIYGVQIGKHRIETDLRYVQKTEDGLSIIEYAVSSPVPDQTILANYLPLTVKLMVAENVLKQRIKTLQFYCAKNKMIYPTMRNPSDFKEVKEAVYKIAACINSEIFYKKYNTQCKTCLYNIICNK